VSVITGPKPLGYKREEVIGKKLTDYLSAVSRKYAEEKIIPAFFKKGFIKDVPYQFIKKNGDLIDVQLSAITDRDEQRQTIRSLAVSIDVTERNKAERALKEAKEALSIYSKDLESQVRKRTREISGILQYTPAVVHIKDADGKYTMVNSRFEELFGIRSSDVRGKTDRDFSPRTSPTSFLTNDERVLHEKTSIQVEERIVIGGDAFTYLSIKFPLYDGKKTGDWRMWNCHGHYCTEKSPGTTASPFRQYYDRSGKRTRLPGPRTSR
jgi:PAS domain S-box-containing protein